MNQDGERTGKETEEGMGKEEEEEEEEEMRIKNISVACLNPSYPSNPSTRKRINHKTQLHQITFSFHIAVFAFSIQQCSII